MDSSGRTKSSVSRDRECTDTKYADAVDHLE